MKPTAIVLFVLVGMLSCKQGPKPSIQVESHRPDYMEIGKGYAQETQKVLGKNLKETIQNEGVAQAVVFCNEQAYPLTDSMATHYKAKIKRVSDKPRNPSNKANPIELAHINTFKEKVAQGDSIIPIVEEKDGKVHFYAPIITQSLCLNCHGTPGKNIAPDVVRHLSELYPQDQAIGYDVDQVRGIWSIVFDAEKRSE
jgi:hypothetical protein